MGADPFKVAKAQTIVVMLFGAEGDRHFRGAVFVEIGAEEFDD